MVPNKKNRSGNEDVVQECTEDFHSDSPLQTLSQVYSSSILEKELAPGKNEPTLKSSNLCTE